MYRYAPLSPKEVIAQAIARRSASLPLPVLDAWRVLNGPGDGAPPGFTLDRYADRGDATQIWLLLSVREGADEAEVQAYCDAAVELLNPAGVLLELRRTEVARSETRLVHGALPQGPLEVREGDAVFLCDLAEDADGLSTGLFLDHRETRFLVRRLAPGKEVLNLFAFTCTFSVHAALAGAKRVTSVDISKRALRRGRENMEASGLDPNVHRWFSDDAIKHLKRRRSQQYGLVILDPPVFGRAHGATFSLARDLPWMAEAALHLLEPEGALVFSTHAQTLSEEHLLQILDNAGRRAGVAANIEERLGLPAWDHPVSGPPTAADRGDYLKTLVIRAGSK